MRQSAIRSKISFFVSSLLLIVGVMAAPVAAQLPTTCPDLVREALSRIETVCSGTGRNQVCYGNTLIEAEARPEASIQFAAPGDLASVLDLLGLRLAGMTVDIPEWGVALLRLQANIPGTLPGQNVTAVIFGDSQIEADPDAPTIDGVPSGIARGFLLRTGFDDSQCAEMPDSGLLLQTPGGVESVSLVINQVDVTLGSTAFIQTTDRGGDGEDDLLIQMLEGEGRVESNGVAQYVQAGQFTSVPLNTDGQANGQPTDPLPYELGDQSLPLPLLERDFTPAGPFTPSGSAPIIRDVVVTQRSDTVTVEQIFFTDAEGDVRSVQLSVVESTPRIIEAIFQGTTVDIPAANQQAGASIVRQTDCTASPNPIDALIRITLTDAAGNTSNVVEYRARCG